MKNGAKMSPSFGVVSASAQKHFQNDYFSRSIYQFRVDRASAAKTVDEVFILGRVKFSQPPHVVDNRAGRFLLFFQYFRWLSIKSGTWVRKYLVKKFERVWGCFSVPAGGVNIQFLAKKGMV